MYVAWMLYEGNVSKHQAKSSITLLNQGFKCLNIKGDYNFSIFFIIYMTFGGFKVTNNKVLYANP